MVAALLLAGLLQQGGAISLTATVDPDRAAVGSEVVFTVSSTTVSASPVELSLPSFDGFTLLSRRERSEVSTGGGQLFGARRVTVWEFHLQAAVAGHFAIGPVRVTQDGKVATAPGVTVDIVPGGAALAAGLDPRVQALLERAPPPPDTGVAVTILPSSETALVGQQIDIVTAAWFPRELRMRLRHPPTLEPPEFEGVWSYPQVVPTGIAASRQVRGTWYDLFILHQIIFPLTAGPLKFTPATLRYGVPVAFQFFSQEDHYALQSAVPRIMALPLPDAGQPAGFSGAAATGLVLSRDVAGPVRAGEPLELSFTLRGEGNVSLWPAPFIRWPAGMPVYSNGTDERIEPLDGRIGGSKVFRYLIVPDSSTVLALPAVDYPYYDLGSSTYQDASVDALRLPVSAGGEMVRARASPPPLLLEEDPAPSWQLVHRSPRWLWGMLLLLPPLFWGWRRRPRRMKPREVRTPRRSVFGEAAGRLEGALRAVAGPEAIADSIRLEDALRGAGVEPALAVRACEVWERVRAFRYAPGPERDPGALAAEAAALAAELAPRVRRGRPGAAGMIPLLLLSLAAARLPAQAPAAEQLYEAGALHAALEGFRSRALAAPAVAARWYDLGATYYRLGQDGDALAAWARAARLDPRSVTLARARLLIADADGVSATWLRPAPVTVDEIALLAAALWLVGWTGLLFTRSTRGRWRMLVAAAVIVAGGAVVLQRWEAVPLAVVRAEVPARLSPYGSAPGSRALPVGTAVHPERQRGGWTLVRAATGEEGWVPDGALASVVDF